MLEKWDYERAIDKISKEVIKAYEQKIININAETSGQVDYYQIERNELLRGVDRNWIDHIDAMDQLRKGIGLRGYAQQDPVIAYKQEGFQMFDEMIDRIRTVTISRLLKGRIVRVQQGRPMPVRRMPSAAPAVPVENAKPAEAADNQKPEAMTPPAAVTPSAGSTAPAIGDAPKSPTDLMANIGGKAQPKVNKSKVGRNDLCPCGSGKKYKDCCYWKDNK